MAGTPAERGGIPVSGTTPQEAGQPQVEYRPFSVVSPQQLADLTGGEFKESTNGMGPYISFQDWYISYGGGGLNWIHPKYKGLMMGASVVAPYLGSGLNEGYSLRKTVVVTKTDEPGTVKFVEPRDSGSGEHDRTEVYDWITVVDKGISIERAPEGSSRVTDEIRHAAGIAWEVSSQIERLLKKEKRSLDPSTTYFSPLQFYSNTARRAFCAGSSSQDARR